jgi:dTDP-4-dehydrorhamnose reductase
VKILVTGRGGQLVNCLVERTAGRAGFEVVALGRGQMDLERPESLGEPIRAVRPDVVINAAAFTAVDQAEDEPERARAVNVEAAGAIAAAARESGARIIQISTDYVFDGTADGPYSEDAPTNPLGVYGRSKLEGEERVRAEAPEHLILRTAWLYSPFGKNFVRTMMHLAEVRDTVSVVADQRGNPTSAYDLADGIVAVLDCWRDDPGRGLGETYHLCGSGEASWCELAAQVMAERRQLGLRAAHVEPISTANWPTRAPRPHFSVLDCSKARKDFGIRLPAWQASVAKVVKRLARGGEGHSDHVL